jgi:hypothetical protein
MKILDRRKFLSLVPSSYVAAVVARPFSSTLLAQSIQSQTYPAPTQTKSTCWLDVCAPFIVVDPARSIHSEIILTSDTFVGTRGYEDHVDQTDYELYLYDANGRGIGPNGLARKLTVSAMQPTVIDVRELVGKTAFWGGLKIRLQPKSREPMHASDLFSSAFVRWVTADSFDNVHANPDPLQWQKAEEFYYSMPFPPLSEYECALSLFNPNDARSSGRITLHDPLGNKLIDAPYDLRAHASLLFKLNAGDFARDVRQIFGFTDDQTSLASHAKAQKTITEGGGMIAISNDRNTQKNFGYLLIKRPTRRRFSIDHPIHEQVFTPAVARKPYDANGKFAAKNVLFSPLMFRASRFGDITFESRFHLSTGLPLEETMWFSLFATDAEGNVPWLSAKDTRLESMLPASQMENGIIKLGAAQTCVLDPARLSFTPGFSGSLSLAVAPNSTHTLMKVEVQVPEWGAHAFTHFRPGLRSARAYQKAKQREGLATDYIISGARVEQRNGRKLFDEIIAIMNIDDKGIHGQPELEVFDARGFISRVELGSIPGFATRYFVVSEMVKKLSSSSTLNLRLVDKESTLLMSAVHLDYERQDIALDHGSDRFSTFRDYGCNATA